MVASVPHGHLELEVDSVKATRFARLRDRIVGQDESGRAHGDGGAQTSGDESLWSRSQQVAIHVRGSAVHDVACQYIFAECLVGKVGQALLPAPCRTLHRRQSINAQHAAIVVDNDYA